MLKMMRPGHLSGIPPGVRVLGALMIVLAVITGLLMLFETSLIPSNLGMKNLALRTAVAAILDGVQMMTAARTDARVEGKLPRLANCFLCSPHEVTTE